MAQGEASAAGDDAGFGTPSAGGAARPGAIHPRALGSGDEESWTGPEGFFGASPATTGRGRGLGSGSTGVDFFGAEDQRYSADSQDEDLAVRGRGKKGNSWNTGWVQDDADEDCMMSELTRITGASMDSYDGDGSSRDDAEAEGVIGGEVFTLRLTSTFIERFYNFELGVAREASARGGGARRKGERARGYSASFCG